MPQWQSACVPAQQVLYPVLKNENKKKEEYRKKKKKAVKERSHVTLAWFLFVCRQ